MAQQSEDTTTGAERSASTQQRKTDHIRINLEQDVYAQGTTTGLERYRFVHNALPECAIDDISTATTFLGHRLEAPILLSSMTGGTDETRKILRTLATAAEQTGCAIGIGSQRAAVEDASLAGFFAVRDVAPNAVVFANLGAVQLNYGIGVEGCRRAVDMVGADALILHLNPIQEAVQFDGNSDFSGLLHKIGETCVALDVPVIVKEVGFGISGPVACRLVEQGVAAIDVGGAGGTSWSAVEAYRAKTRLQRALGEAFSDWGIPTAESLRMVRAAVPDTPVIASGGLRDGVDAAKAIALGASLAGFAGPFLRAAAMGVEQLVETVTIFREQLRLAMFGTGITRLDELRHVPLISANGTLDEGPR